ncbi:hypothetical protein EBZ39_11435 [bacterium]|nr:hypothetical protein [bacterium]
MDSENKVTMELTQKEVELIQKVRQYEQTRMSPLDDNWYPACGGTEQVFRSRSGRRLLYCWQPSTGKHVYFDVDNDVFLTNQEAELAMMMY